MEAENLESVYFDCDEAKGRYINLLATFRQYFDGSNPQFIVRSPGRVNIIGDHIDYSNFPCLPAAIAFDVIMAVEVVEDKSDPGFSKVQLVNTDAKFSPVVFESDPDVKIETPSWGNYFKCSWIKTLQHLKIFTKDQARGLKVAITGNVPIGGGLSSSAAFVVSGCMACLKAHRPEAPFTKDELVKLSTTCEQLVGVNSGGLDQSASIYGQKDQALLISFKPKLEVKPLQFSKTQDPIVFLIADSLVQSSKLDTAPENYNLRVVEVTLAARVLAKKLDVDIPRDGNLQGGTLHGVLTNFCGPVSLHSLEQMSKIVDQHLKQDPYSAEEVADVLDLSLAEFEKQFLSAFPVRFKSLKLHRRAKHVYEETSRVLSFVHAMSSNAHPRVLGDLMNQSQNSAECLFENSHPDCDAMCAIARKAGSLGSRVTGAGWGGCTVHLVLKSKAQDVRQALLQEYYQVKHPNAPKDSLVQTRPSGGSALFTDIDGLLK